MSEFITVLDGAKLTKDYRESREDILASGKPVNILPICETFDKSHIETLISNPDCAALRVYFGRDVDGNVVLVLVGVNEEDEDIIDGACAVLDRAKRCPFICPPSSPLNS
jgi:hypothetical protein